MMGILEELNERMKRIEILLQTKDPVKDTRMVDSSFIIRDLNVSRSVFHNRILPELIERKIIKKISGKYKARLCDYEEYKRC